MADTVISTIAPTDTWRDQALCIGSPDLFFWDQGGSKRGEVRRARAICNRCPVRAPCLEYALKLGPSHGMWGGHTARQLRHHPDNPRKVAA